MSVQFLENLVKTRLKSINKGEKFTQGEKYKQG